jgi:hypothetical protein
MHQQGGSIVCSRALEHGLSLLIFKIVDTKNPISMLVEFIITELVANVPGQCQEDGNADGKSNNIDGRE